ncbi:MAG: hypothetical protein HFE90_06060 [Firmicutes bacterium]|nr:hypothetical protein [Bacillota bacterium]
MREIEICCALHENELNLQELQQAYKTFSQILNTMTENKKVNTLDLSHMGYIHTYISEALAIEQFAELWEEC